MRNCHCTRSVDDAIAIFFLLIFGMILCLAILGTKKVLDKLIDACEASPDLARWVKNAILAQKRAKRFRRNRRYYVIKKRPGRRSLCIRKRLVRANPKSTPKVDKNEICTPKLANASQNEYDLTVTMPFSAEYLTTLSDGQEMESVKQINSDAESSPHNEITKSDDEEVEQSGILKPQQDINDA